MKTTYDLLAPVYETVMDDVVFAVYLERIARYGHPENVLEAGCGTAAISRALAKQGKKVTAMDISEEMLEVAAYYAGLESLDITFLKHDLRDPFEGTYDMVIMPVDVINHLGSEHAVQAAIKHIEAVLTPGGLLIFDYLTCDALTSMIGHKETIQFKHNDVTWWVEKGNAPCTITHYVQKSGKQTSHIEQSYSEAFFKDLIKNFTQLDKTTLDGRIILVLKKEK